MPEPAAYAPDRTFVVPRGARVLTDYIRLDRVRLACRDRMAVGDVETAYRRLLAVGARGQQFPCPHGEWDGETFVIQDGRHEYVAALMLGFEALLVAWVELAP
jgi:hypothetical protein